MTILTNSTIYSFYTPFSEAGTVVVSRRPQLSLQQSNIQVSLSGDTLVQRCGVYCSRKPRTLSSTTGIEAVAWGGLDSAQTACDCELSTFSAPIKWILSALGECLNVRCGFYNSAMDPRQPLNISNLDRQTCISNANELLTHVPLSRLVASAKPGVHFFRETADTSKPRVVRYLNQIRYRWRAHFIGRILPTSEGSRVSAIGEHVTVRYTHKL